MYVCLSVCLSVCKQQHSNYKINYKEIWYGRSTPNFVSRHFDFELVWLILRVTLHYISECIKLCTLHPMTIILIYFKCHRPSEFKNIC
jgi:hypothetical protein